MDVDENVMKDVDESIIKERRGKDMKRRTGCSRKHQGTTNDERKRRIWTKGKGWK